MTNKITAVFVRERLEDSGSDQVLDYSVYEFTDIIDDAGKKYSDKWIKETKLMNAVSFEKGKRYMMTLSSELSSAETVKMPYPLEVSWGSKEKVYMKRGNSIIRVDKKGEEENLSVSKSKILDRNTSEMAALKKFNEGAMTKDLLLKMNERGIFYYVHSEKNGTTCYGASKTDTENSVLIQKGTQEEIDQTLKSIKQSCVKKDIEKYFTVKTEILPSKSRKN